VDAPVFNLVLQDTKVHPTPITCAVRNLFAQPATPDPKPQTPNAQTRSLFRKPQPLNPQPYPRCLLQAPNPKP